MYMRSFGFVGMLLAASASCAVPLQPAIVVVGDRSAEAGNKRRLRGQAPRSRRYRARGPEARPKRRRNMVRLGRRVRRKHRRAA